MIKKLVFVLASLFLTISLNAQKKLETQIIIKTTLGDITIKLYNETPIHRDNFIKLVESNFYDSLLFHRVIKNFMVQAGDPKSKNAAAGQQLGSGGTDYTLPAEITPTLIHKKGALSAARLGDNMNPKKESSGCQFYIVQGTIVNEQQLTQMETNVSGTQKQQLFYEFIAKPENAAMRNKIDSLQKAKDQDGLTKISIELDKLMTAELAKKGGAFKYTPEQRLAYTTVGGTPHLDMNYTVFGEVVTGLDIVDKIAAVAVGQGDRPVTDVKIISMKIIK